MKKPRLIDPIYFFNNEGVSAVNVKHLMNRNALLEHQNERLMRMLRAQVERNKIVAENAIPPILH